MLPTKEDMYASDCKDGSFTPARIIQVEISQPFPRLISWDEQSERDYQRAICLVRLHTQPLGIVELVLGKNEELVQEHVQQVWLALGPQINEHLRMDGLPPLSNLEENGIVSMHLPRCLEERERFLKTAPFVSVIIPTCNRANQLHRCLQSLLAMDYPRYEIIVVDNAPGNPETCTLIQQIYRDIPMVRYICEEQPGVSYARNSGMFAACGKILAFTDDDVVVDKYWLVELVRGFNLSEEVACVTGLVLPLELEVLTQDWFEQYGGYSKGFSRRIFDRAKNRIKHPLYPHLPGSFGTGACMAFKADYLRCMHGFDTTLDYLGSDIEALFQVVMNGHKLVYEPAAVVQHLHFRAYERLRKQIYVYGMGLTAFLTKCVMQSPKQCLHLLAKLPYGCFFLLSGQSQKNKKRQTDYPKELVMSELKGMLHGPIEYLQRRRAVQGSQGLMRQVEPQIVLSTLQEISVSYYDAQESEKLS